MIKEENKQNNTTNLTAASEWRTDGGEQMSVSGSGNADALGLSKVHIRPYENKYGYVSYYPGAHLIAMKTPWMYKNNNRRTTKRNEISGFSKGSRKRMMNMVSKINRDTLPIFVTLTYPEKYPSAKESK